MKRGAGTKKAKEGEEETIWDPVLVNPDNGREVKGRN